jgi:hypothetical protein
LSFTADFGNPHPMSISCPGGIGICYGPVHGKRRGNTAPGRTFSTNHGRNRRPTTGLENGVPTSATGPTPAQVLLPVNAVQVPTLDSCVENSPDSPLPLPRRLGDPSGNDREILGKSSTSAQPSLVMTRPSWVLRQTLFDLAENAFVFVWNAFVFLQNAYVLRENVFVFFQNAYLFGQNVFAFLQNAYVFGQNVFVFLQNAYVFGQNVFVFLQNAYLFGQNVFVFLQNAYVFGQNVFLFRARLTTSGRSAWGSSTSPRTGYAIFWRFPPALNPPPSS